MSDRPNILIFMTDQMVADVADPAHPCKMPNAAKLASEGVRFTRAYTPCPHCCPSRATFMTGLYPSRHGIFNNVLTATAINRGLAEGVRCFSEDLAAAGYRMPFSGKWHVSAEENPAERGWDERVVRGGKKDSHHQSLDHWRKFKKQDENRERPRGHILRPGWGDRALYGTSPRPFTEHNDYHVTRMGIEALREVAASDDPWCVYIGPHGPHDPFVVPGPFAGMHDPANVELPESYRDNMEDKPRIYQRHRRQYWDQLSEDEVRESIAYYWDYCAMEDALFGQVIDALDASGQADNTLLLFMSDHGEYCGAHGLYCKGVPSFREAYNIPVIARWPARLKSPGRVASEIVTLADFAPTFLEAAGIDAPDNLSGRSLIPILEDNAPSDWRDCFCSQFNGVELYYTQRIVQTDRWKYVYNGFDFDELYDLKNDPHEMTNLAADEVSRPVIRELCKKMWQFAAKEEDYRLFNAYFTVAMAPFGPGEAGL